MDSDYHEIKFMIKFDIKNHEFWYKETLKLKRGEFMRIFEILEIIMVALNGVLSIEILINMCPHR